MITGFLHMHSALRWVALVLLVLVVAKALGGRSGNKPFTEARRSSVSSP